MRRARLHFRRGEKNKTEQAFESEMLEPRKLAGELVWYGYEPLTFRIAKKTSYTPDYMALRADGTMEAWEVKGTWKDQHYQHSRVKVKVAAAMFPMFPFRVAMRGGKGEPRWKVEEIGIA